MLFPWFRRPVRHNKILIFPFFLKISCIVCNIAKNISKYSKTDGFEKAIYVAYKY